MSPLPRRMLGRAASWENPQVRPSSLPERRLTYVGVAVAIRFFVGFPHQILISRQLPQADTAQIAEHGTKAGYCVCYERPATA